MPRFFFTLADGEIVPDDVGMMLSDAQAAHREALRGARGIMAEEVRQGHLPLRDRIEVTDEAGDPVLTLPFRDAILIEE